MFLDCAVKESYESWFSDRLFYIIQLILKTSHSIRLGYAQISFLWANLISMEFLLCFEPSQGNWFWFKPLLWSTHVCRGTGWLQVHFLCRKPSGAPSRLWPLLREYYALGPVVLFSTSSFPIQETQSGASPRSQKKKQSLILNLPTLFFIQGIYITYLIIGNKNTRITGFIECSISLYTFQNTHETIQTIIIVSLN